MFLQINKCVDDTLKYQSVIYTLTITLHSYIILRLFSFYIATNNNNNNNIKRSNDTLNLSGKVDPLSSLWLFILGYWHIQTYCQTQSRSQTYHNRRRKKMKFWNTLYIFVYTITASCCAYDANRKCEPNRAALCKDLYNETRFPNFYDHHSQNDAIEELSQYKDLIQTGCAAHLRLFLCSVLIPMYTILEENILPCRSLCEEAKAGCEPALLEYVDLPWPERLKCDQFPVSSSDRVCVENKNAQPNKKKWGKIISFDIFPIMLTWFLGLFFTVLSATFD